MGDAQPRYIIGEAGPELHAGLPAPSITPRSAPNVRQYGYACLSCGAPVQAIEQHCSYCTTPRPAPGEQRGRWPAIPQPEPETRR